MKFNITLIAIMVISTVGGAQTKSATASSQMKLKKSSLVMTYNLSQVPRMKDGTPMIPRVQVGTEAVISAESPASSPRSLASTTPLQIQKVPAVEKSISLGNPLSDLKMVTIKPQIKMVPGKTENISLKEYIEPTLKESELNQQKVVEFKNNDEKFLQALIFLEIKRKHALAMGLFVDLFQDPKYEYESRYYYGIIAHHLKLYSEFRSQLLKVAKSKSSKTLRTNAVQRLIDLSTGLDVADVPEVEKLQEELDMDSQMNSHYALLKAKYYSEKTNLGLVEQALLSITEKDPEYIEAQLIKSLLLYRTGQVNEAMTLIKSLVEDKRLNNQDMLGIAYITLARIHFQKAQYKEAWNAYLKVGKDHPLWLDAMTEQALTQIMAQDFEGSAGNLFSLHTDFFKNAFAPETYTLRSVSYLNLCQFGDGLQVLNQFKRKYSGIKTTLEKLKAESKGQVDFYDAIKTWSKHPDLKVFNGVPKPFLIEMARHPVFLNAQKKINKLEDEREQFAQVVIDIIRLEKENNKALSELKLQLLKAKGDTVMARVAEIEQNIALLELENKIYKNSKDQVKKTRNVSEERITSEKVKIKADTLVSLNDRFNKLLVQLNSQIEQSEALLYEIYSGAGEHLRFQIAGGDISKEKRDELKVGKDQAQTWKFKGEIWEDEVGHYRSSLKNVCPESEKRAVSSINN